MPIKLQKLIFFISIFIHLLFYLSIPFPFLLNGLFDQVTIGQDFFQIPNGAYSFMHGKSLTGQDRLYTSCCSVNTNVYHPLFTILVGTPLQIFHPWIAYILWVIVHAISTIIIVMFIFQKFKKNAYLYISIALFLLNAFHFYEIHHAQYHFLFNFFTFFFLYEAVKHGDTKKAGLFYFLSLLVKPIGLLWLLPLLFSKRFQTLFIGLFLFLVASVPFYVMDIDKYYFTNLYAVSMATIPSTNLLNLVWVFPNFRYLIELFIKISSYISFILLILFQVYKKPPFHIIIFLWVCFQLLYYNLVFHYHFTTVSIFLCLCYLFKVLSLQKRFIIPIIFLTVPAPFFLYNLGIATSLGLLLNEALSGLWSDLWLIVLIFAIVIRYSKNQNHAINT